MTTQPAINFQPSFLKAPSGQLFVLRCTHSSKPNSKWILHIPAFAEEMNKSRPMVSAMARRFAADGYNVVIPDLYGTGDSGGEFVEANCSRWLEDLKFLAQWIVGQGASSICLWGLRTGCLLVPELINSLGEPEQQKIQRVIFWQPVLRGKQFITQFLRLRVAAAMMSGKKETVAELRKLLEEQGRLEVAGYTLSAELVSEFDDLQMSDRVMIDAVECDWYEVASSSDKGLTPVARRLVEDWHSRGVVVRDHSVEGEPFWATQEIAMAPVLLDATKTAIGSVPEGSQVGLAENNHNVSDAHPEHAEQAVVFECNGARLVGIIHHTAVPAIKGVVLVVGGPQYRVGSHRQFVLLARALAKAGIPVLRFDYRGMGDSTGEFVGFEGISEDIKAAIDQFQQQIPGISDVVLWGLCDAATACSFYAQHDSRVSGLVLLNPWVRSEQGEAKAFIKHYYVQRLFSRAFWQKALRGDLQVVKSLGALLENLRRAKSGGATDDQVDLSASPKSSINYSATDSLADRVCAGLSAFKGKTLLVFSGNDLMAAEFKDVVVDSKPLGALLNNERFHRVDLIDSDHTFSRQVWRDKVAEETIAWVKS